MTQDIYWEAFEGGRTIGQTGSEGGEIIKDMEAPNLARITLEKGGKLGPYTITCGLYGNMIHSFPVSAETAFDEALKDLGAVIDALPESDASDEAQQVFRQAMEAFVSAH